jgi:hypothetical protein
MKILITADIHFRLHWFCWLIKPAPEFDLIRIAGDLLDMFKSETRLVTAITYHCSRQETSIWLVRGSALCRQTGMPWIVGPELESWLVRGSRYSRASARAWLWQRIDEAGRDLGDDAAAGAGVVLKVNIRIFQSSPSLITDQ